MNYFLIPSIGRCQGAQHDRTPVQALTNKDPAIPKLRYLRINKGYRRAPSWRTKACSLLHDPALPFTSCSGDRCHCAGASKHARHDGYGGTCEARTSGGIRLSLVSGRRDLNQPGEGHRLILEEI
jgi:hypothetical protein